MWGAARQALRVRGWMELEKEKEKEEGNQQQDEKPNQRRSEKPDTMASAHARLLLVRSFVRWTSPALQYVV